MRSLYVKVLAWFLTTVAVTGAGLLWVLSPDNRMQVAGGPMFRRVPVLQLELARRAWERGGREELQRNLDWVASVAELHGAFTDATGIDLATGENRTEVVAKLKARSGGLPVLHDGRLVNGIASTDGKYWLVFHPLQQQGPLGPPGRPPIFPSYLWVFASVGLLSLWLAYHLTKPLRELRNRVEQFGSGDLSVRVHSRRRDEVGQLAHTFDQMADRISNLVDSQRRLLADLSHELRSPLTRLGLAVELARSGEGGDRGALDRIQREADRLNVLVGGLLEVTRGEANPNAVAKVPVRLDELVATIVDDCKVDAAERGCRIVSNKPGPVVIDGNPELLRRAVENILRNATRYSPPNEEIVVDIAHDAERATIAIRDRGPGVPSESLPHLFDAFYRVNQSGKETGKGYGLGLSIAKRAVELHAGTIRASNAQPGLRVVITVPVRVEPVAAA